MLLAVKVSFRLLKPTRPLAELAKIRRYSARLSRIIVLLFNKLSTKRIGQRDKWWLCSALKDFRRILAPYLYRRISVMYG